MELSPQVGGLTTTPTKFTLKSSIREAPALTIMFTMPTVIAALAVYSKQLAERLASRDARWLSFMGIAMRFGGGIAIMLFGAILFMASLYGPTGSM